MVNMDKEKIKKEKTEQKHREDVRKQLIENIDYQGIFENVINDVIKTIIETTIPKIDTIEVEGNRVRIKFK